MPKKEELNELELAAAAFFSRLHMIYQRKFNNNTIRLKYSSFLDRFITHERVQKVELRFRETKQQQDVRSTFQLTS